MPRSRPRLLRARLIQVDVSQPTQNCRLIVIHQPGQLGNSVKRTLAISVIGRSAHRLYSRRNGIPYVTCSFIGR